jgi:hypothetical protein
MDQLLGGGENFAISWQGVTKHEPCGTPLAIFKVLEKTTIEGIGDAA